MCEKISYCGLYCGACPSYQKKTCLGCRSNNKKQNRIEYQNGVAKFVDAALN